MSLWVGDAKFSNILVNLDHIVAVEKRKVSVKGSADTFSLVATATNGKEFVIEAGMTDKTIGGKIRGIKASIIGALDPIKEALQERADQGDDDEVQ